MNKRIVFAALGGGLLLQSGCLNTLFSIQFCGTVLPTSVCTPEDQLLLVWPFLEVPNFRIDPTCTIPYGCIDRDDVTDGLFPFGGGPPDQPAAGTGGGGGAGGGAGGGGGGI